MRKVDIGPKVDRTVELRFCSVKHRLLPERVARVQAEQPGRHSLRPGNKQHLWACNELRYLPETGLTHHSCRHGS